MQQWNKGPGRKPADTSEERDNIQQDLPEDNKIEDRKVNGRVFDWDAGSEWLDIVEGSPPSKTKEETSKAQSSKKRNGGTPVGYSGRVALRREPCGM
jgi:hypothetical protein